MTTQDLFQTGRGWWVKNYQTANEWFEKNIGDEMSVSIFDVMPNLRTTEYQIEKGAKSQTNAPIDVFVNKQGVLVIADGHHRFNDAISLGKIRVDVRIINVNVSSIFTGENKYFSL